MSRYVGTIDLNFSDDIGVSVYSVKNFIPDENNLTIPNSNICKIDTDMGTLTGYDESGNILYMEDIVNLVKDIPIRVN